MNHAVSLLVALAVAGGLYLAACAWIANRLTRSSVKPQRAPVAPAQASSDAVNFMARDGRARIAGWYLPAEQPGAAVVLVLEHGTAERPAAGQRPDPTAAARTQALARALRHKGISVLMIHLRGHGLSSAARTAYGELERHDVLGAVDYLIGRGYRAGQIGVIGAAVGASAALLAAADEPAIRAVVADSPGGDFASAVRHQLRGWPGLAALVLPLAQCLGRVLACRHLGRMPLLAGVAALQNRAVLIVHGQGDPRVAPAVSQEAALACGAHLWLTASHAHAGSFRESPPLYITRVAEFLGQQLLAPRTVCVIWPQAARPVPAPAWERLAA